MAIIDNVGVFAIASALKHNLEGKGSRRCNDRDGATTRELKIVG